MNTHSGPITRSKASYTQAKSSTAIIPAPAPKPLTTVYSKIVTSKASTNKASSSSIIPSQTKLPTKHVKNPNKEFLCLIETEYSKNCTTALDIAKRIFYKDWYFHSHHPQKNQQFYEFVLIDTDSIRLKQHIDPKNPNSISHTTVSILRVLNIHDWGSSPTAHKSLSQVFSPQTYNYFDYVQAWQHAFHYQNPEQRHSWFFAFDPKMPDNTLPLWFTAWWCYYGPLDSILPPTVTEAFHTFKEYFDIQHQIPELLSFFIHCKLPWIMYWEFEWDKSSKSIPTLSRVFHTKWWTNFNLERCSKSTIIQSYNRITQKTQQMTLTKSQVQASLASIATTASSRKEIKAHIQALQASLDDHPGSDSDDDTLNTASPSSDSLGDSNHDMEYGMPELPTTSQDSHKKHQKDGTSRS